MKNDFSEIRDKFWLFQRAAFLLLIVFFGDVILTGSGAWSLNLLGFSLRKVVFLGFELLIFCSLIGYGLTVKNAWAIFVVVFFSITWGLFIPSLHETNLSYAFADLMPVFGLLTIFVFRSFKYGFAQWNQFESWIFLFCKISAIFHLVIYFTWLLAPGYIDPLKAFLQNYMANQADGTIDNIIISETPGGGFRILLPSSIFLLVGFYIAVKKVICNFSPGNFLLIFVFSLALYSTWARAFYVLPVIFCILYIAFCFFFRAAVDCFDARYVILFFAAILISVAASGLFVAPELTELIGLANDGDELRQYQIPFLLATFFDNFLFGIGMGGSAEIVRSELAPWTYEMALLALLMKIGLVGGLIVIIVIYTALVGLRFFSDDRDLTLKRQRIWLSMILPLVFIFSTNPFLFSLAGVGVVMYFYMDLINITGAGRFNV